MTHLEQYITTIAQLYTIDPTAKVIEHDGVEVTPELLAKRMEDLDLTCGEYYQSENSPTEF